MNKQAIKWWIVILGLTCASAAFAQSSSSNSTLLMRIEGPAGPMEGEVTQAGREGSHRLLAYSHEIISPRDAASGLPTGKRQHKPFRIVKLINKSSPLLLNAMAKNQTLPSIEIDVWSPGGAAGGQEILFFTYTLTDASIASIRPWMPNTSDPSTRAYPPAEEVSFTYQKIEWRFHNGSIVGEDDWDSGVRKKQ